MTDKTKTGITWETACRIVGLAMLAILFLSVLVFHSIGRDLDGAQVLGFLGVITTLVGIPSGWQLIKRNGTGGGGGGAEPPKG